MIQEKLKRLFDYDDIYIDHSDISNDIMLEAAEDDNSYSILLAQSIIKAIDIYAYIKDRVFISKNASILLLAFLLINELKRLEHAITTGLYVMGVLEEYDEQVFEETK